MLKQLNDNTVEKEKDIKEESKDEEIKKNETESNDGLEQWINELIDAFREVPE